MNKNMVNIHPHQSLQGIGSRAGQNILGITFQTQTYSLAQNMTVYQVLGPLVKVLPPCKKRKDANAGPF